ncbi:MAG TPA: carbohydrate ABC transporter permease [Actinocrinis sp.]|nr:carbohydrate ABC transporter permease [Actinocrinis sp.]
MAVTQRTTGERITAARLTAPAGANAKSARRVRRSRARTGNPSVRPKSPMLTAAMTLTLIYALLPLFWLLVNASKTQSSLFTTSGLWFGGKFALFDNIGKTFSYDNGVFLRWFGNTLLYVVVGAGGATLLATLGGYALAKFDFPGKRGALALILGAVAVPGLALAVPSFLMFSKLGLTNTPWAIILPSLVNPFGLYLIQTYARDAVPTELLEAARVDGMREYRIFFSIALYLMRPAMITVLLFSVVATWNNYFLPLIMLSKPDWYPLTVGLNQWNSQASTVGGEAIYNLVITGSLLTVVPIMIAFLIMQRYWQSGLATGSVKG